MAMADMARILIHATTILSGFMNPFLLWFKIYFINVG
jgi:hypothetical protein